jgi:ammonia channel protein AmtB
MFYWRLQYSPIQIFYWRLQYNPDILLKITVLYYPGFYVVWESSGVLGLAYSLYIPLPLHVHPFPNW